MALRDQPYLPLYVQDFLTDEKLRECSAGSVGVYIMTMCLMHKSSEYGTILLWQKDKQTSDDCLNFANKLTKHLPYTSDVILNSLKELINMGVLTIDGDKLMQLRMVKDNSISLKRAKAGSKGYFAKAKVEAKALANSENENEIESKDKQYIISIGGQKFQKKISQVLLEDFTELFQTCMMVNHSGKPQSAILNAMDKLYPIYDFNDQNHLLKALQKVDPNKLTQIQPTIKRNQPAK